MITITVIEDWRVVGTEMNELQVKAHNRKSVSLNDTLPSQKTSVVN